MDMYRYIGLKHQWEDRYSYIEIKLLVYKTISEPKECIVTKNKNICSPQKCAKYFCDNYSLSKQN